MDLAATSFELGELNSTINLWRQKTAQLHKIYQDSVQEYFNCQLNQIDPNLTAVKNKIITDQLLEDLKNKYEELFELKFYLKAYALNGKNSLGFKLFYLTDELVKLLAKNLELKKLAPENISPKELVLFVKDIINFEFLNNDFENQLSSNSNLVASLNLATANLTSFKFIWPAGEKLSMPHLDAIVLIFSNLSEIFNAVFETASLNLKLIQVQNESVSCVLITDDKHSKHWTLLFNNLTGIISNPTDLLKIVAELLLLSEKRKSVNKKQLLKYVKNFSSSPISLLKDWKIINPEVSNLSKGVNSALNLIGQTNALPFVDAQFKSPQMAKIDSIPDVTSHESELENKNNEKLRRKNHINFLTGG